jgi:metal-dependent hydrolase (beta-lactamase superfamily II)
MEAEDFPMALITGQLQHNLFQLNENDGLYLNVDAYLLVGKDRALLIDTLQETEELYERVRKITDKPLDVAISHGHPDHAGRGLKQFHDAGIDIWMAEADIAVYKDRRFAKIINYDLDGEGIVDTINEFEVTRCAAQQYINRLRNEDIFVVRKIYGKQDVIINRYGQVLISCAYPNILIVGSYICVYRDYNEYEFYSKDGVHLKDIPNHYVEQFHKKLEDIENGSLYKSKRRRRRIYNDETPKGCGEGWSCSNCPNA